MAYYLFAINYHFSAIDYQLSVMDYSACYDYDGLAVTYNSL